LDSNCIKKRSAGAQACRGSLQHSPDYLAEFKGAALQQGSDGREETKGGEKGNHPPLPIPGYATMARYKDRTELVN